MMTKPCSYLIVIILCFVLYVPYSMASTGGHSISFTVSDGESSQVLTLGIHAEGALHFVPDLDLLAPPPAPEGAFDARIRVQGTNYFTKFLPKTAAEQQFLIRFRERFGNEAISLAWTDNGLLDNATVMLKDRFGGAIISVPLHEQATSFKPADLHPVLMEGFVIVVQYHPSTSAGQQDEVPHEVHLYQNYPNPFNSNTNIPFTLSRQAELSVSLYSIQGELIGNLFSGLLGEGRHTIPFDASSLTSGTYFVKINTMGQTATIKMTHIK